MSKFIIFNKASLINKIQDLLKVKELHSTLEAEINQKIADLEVSMKDCFTDTPKLAEIFGSYCSDRKEAKFSLRTPMVSKQSELIRHYVGALASERCLTDLGWEFDLSSETFQTILDQDQEKTIQQHLDVLHNSFGRFIEIIGEIKPTTKFKADAFPLYVTPHIVANLTNLLYRLTNQDKYFVWTGYFDHFENEFFKVTTEHASVEEEDVAYFTFTFTDVAVEKLNDALKKFSPPKTNDNDEYI